MDTKCYVVRPVSTAHDANKNERVPYSSLSPGAVFVLDDELFMAIATSMEEAFSLDSYKIKEIGGDTLVIPLHDVILSLIK
jgi:hypothetical protein